MAASLLHRHLSHEARCVTSWRIEVSTSLGVAKRLSCRDFYYRIITYTLLVICSPSTPFLFLKDKEGDVLVRVSVLVTEHHDVTMKATWGGKGVSH